MSGKNSAGFGSPLVFGKEIRFCLFILVTAMLLISSCAGYRSSLTVNFELVDWSFQPVSGILRIATLIHADGDLQDLHRAELRLQTSEESKVVWIGYEAWKFVEQSKNKDEFIESPRVELRNESGEDLVPVGFTNWSDSVNFGYPSVKIMPESIGVLSDPFIVITWVIRLSEIPDNLERVQILCRIKRKNETFTEWVPLGTRRLPKPRPAEPSENKTIGRVKKELQDEPRFGSEREDTPKDFLSALLDSPTSLVVPESKRAYNRVVLNQQTGQFLAALKHLPDVYNHGAPLSAYSALDGKKKELLGQLRTEAESSETELSGHFRTIDALYFRFTVAPAEKSATQEKPFPQERFVYFHFVDQSNHNLTEAIDSLDPWIISSGLFLMRQMSGKTNNLDRVISAYAHNQDVWDGICRVQLLQYVSKVDPERYQQLLAEFPELDE